MLPIKTSIQWTFKRTGSKNRVVLPSCAVNIIKREFSSGAQSYTVQDLDTVEPRYSVHHWGNGKCILYQSVCYIKVLHKVNKKSGFYPGDGVIQLTNGCV